MMGHALDEAEQFQEDRRMKGVATGVRFLGTRERQVKSDSALDSVQRRPWMLAEVREEVRPEGSSWRGRSVVSCALQQH